MVQVQFVEPAWRYWSFASYSGLARRSLGRQSIVHGQRSREPCRQGQAWPSYFCMVQLIRSTRLFFGTREGLSGLYLFHYGLGLDNLCITIPFCHWAICLEPDVTSQDVRLEIERTHKCALHSCIENLGNFCAFK
jgi:hypothetical protein